MTGHNLTALMFFRRLVCTFCTVGRFPPDLESDLQSDSYWMTFVGFTNEALWIKEELNLH